MPCTAGKLSGKNIIGIPISTAAGCDYPLNRKPGAIGKRMVWIAEFKSSVLGVIDIIHHHAIYPMVVSCIAVPGKIQIVVFRKVEVDI